jgi:hypothetical protein
MTCLRPGGVSAGITRLSYVALPKAAGNGSSWDRNVLGLAGEKECGAVTCVVLSRTQGMILFFYFQRSIPFPPHTSRAVASGAWQRGDIEPALLCPRLQAWEKQASSARRVKRARKHSESAMCTVWRRIGRGPGGSSEPHEPRIYVVRCCRPCSTSCTPLASSRMLYLGVVAPGQPQGAIGG